MTVAVEADPYILPLPGPDTPVIPAHRVFAQHAHLNSRYGDRKWPLAPLIDDPSHLHHEIDWDAQVPAFREEMRLITWTFLNGELKPSFLLGRGPRLRSRLSPGSAFGTVRFWRGLCRWLDARGVRSLAECDQQVLHAYGLHLRDSGVSRLHVHAQLTAVMRLWAFDQLSVQPIGVARPPWDEFGIDDYLPAATAAGGENAREPLAEETIGPLLVWAIRLIEDLADDIITAATERRRMIEAASSRPSTPQGRAALDAFIAERAAAGQPLPSTRKRGKPALARYYLAEATGSSMGQVAKIQRKRDRWFVTDAPGTCPLPVPVTGRISGRPWRDRLDFDETEELLRHLVTAAFIVCSYLSGMRPQEVLAMRSGCCPEPEADPDGLHRRHLIHIAAEDVGEDGTDEDELDEPTLLIRSRHYKSAVDEDGNHLSSGVERLVPWVAISPVINAIRVLERLVPPGELLFSGAVHSATTGNANTGSLKLDGARRRVESFIGWANDEATAQDLSNEIIADDPFGAVGTARFRRTLAWHIARQPGGLVALAIQYGHLRTALDTDQAGRYGNRSRNGIHAMIDVATALTTAEAAARLHERFLAGEGISGPAARQALTAGADVSRFEGRLIKVDFARKYLGRDGAVLYDNPHALLLCLFRRDKALCAKDGPRATPSLDRCVPGCSNIVRTDELAAQLHERADQLDRKAELCPGMLATRLHANAAKLRHWANEHDHSRFTAEEATA